MSAEDHDDAKQAWCDHTADQLRPTGVDDPEAVAEALFHAGLALVPAVPSEGLTEEERRVVDLYRWWLTDPEQDPIDEPSEDAEKATRRFLAIIDRLAPPPTPEDHP